MDTISIYDVIRGLGPLEIGVIGVIMLVFAIALIVNFITITKYRSMMRCFDNVKQTKSGIFGNDLLNIIVQDYKLAAKSSMSEVNTQAIIEKCFNAHLKIINFFESFIRKSPSMLVILGLFGTFWGLTISVTKLMEVISSNLVSGVDINMDLLLTRLSDTASGMGFAFTTSLFGILFNIVLTLIFIVAGSEKSRESLMVMIEEYLDNTVAVAISKDKETEYTMLNNILKETFVEFGAKIQESLKQTVEDFGDKMTNVVMDVSLSSQTLDQTVERFDHSLENFGNNMKSLSEFNTNMRNNIQMMDVNFIKLTEALTKTGSQINENYEAMRDFSDQVRKVSEQITAFNSDILTQIESIVKNMEHTVTSVSKFNDNLQQNIDQNANDMDSLQKSFSESLQTFNQELKSTVDLITKGVLQALETGNQHISLEVTKNLTSSLDEFMNVMEDFKENERIFAKTIAMLPQQVVTYNRVTSTNIESKLDELKTFVEKLDEKITASPEEDPKEKKKKEKQS